MAILNLNVLFQAIMPLPELLEAYLNLYSTHKQLYYTYASSISLQSESSIGKSP